MFTHRIDEESNWGGRGWPSVRKCNPRIFFVFNWLVHGVWDEKVLESFSASRKHHESIESIYWLQESTENLLKIMFCVDAVLVRREKGESFLHPNRAVKVDRKVSLMKFEIFLKSWWNCLTNVASQIFYLFHFLKSIFTSFSRIFFFFNFCFHTSEVTFKIFRFLWESTTSTLFSLVYSKAILPHELIYILITLLRLENFSSIVRNFLALSVPSFSLLISWWNRSENKVRSEKERRKFLIRQRQRLRRPKSTSNRSEDCWKTDANQKLLFCWFFMVRVEKKWKLRKTLKAHR